MALSLGVRVGRKIQIGKSMLEVVAIHNDGKHVVVDVEGQTFNLSDEESTEVLPDVKVFCGSYGDYPGEWNTEDGRKVPISKLAFEAPRSIKINRL